MCDHYYGDALTVYFRKQMHEDLFIFGIQRTGRLICQYHTRFVHQRTRYGDALTLTAR